MEIHLHIGAHRTGTTSAQKLLESRSAQLRAAGVVFRGPSALRGWGLYDLLQRMTDARAPVDRIEAAQQVLRDWVTKFGPVRRVVISDENLSGTMLQNYTDAALYPDAEARFQALGQLLPAQPDVVCVTIRDLVGYWQSVFAHLAMLGKLDTFDAERLAKSPRKSWLPLVQGVRTAFPKARLKIMRYDSTVVERLVAELVGPGRAARLPTPKRSFGLALTDEIMASLHALPVGPGREALSLRLRETRDTADRAFSAAQARELDVAYSADWQALRAGGIAGAVLDPAPMAGDVTT